MDPSLSKLLLVLLAELLQDNSAKLREGFNDKKSHFQTNFKNCSKYFEAFPQGSRRVPPSRLCWSYQSPSKICITHHKNKKCVCHFRLSLLKV